MPMYSLLSFGSLCASIILCWSLAECSIIATTSLFIIIIIIISTLCFSIFIIVIVLLKRVLTLWPWDRVTVFIYLVL